MKSALISLIILLSATTKAQLTGVQNVDSETFFELVSENNGIVLDVRTPGEYSRGHIDGSTLISTNDSKVLEKLSLLQKNKPIYVYCLTGSRSRAVANYLNQNGYNQIYNLQRGIIEWQQYGYPVVQNRAPIASSSKTYSETEFSSLITSDELVLIDFHAVWCAPCKKMSPIIDKLQSNYAGKVIVGKIDIEANKSLKNTHDIESVPGLVLFNRGEEVWRHTGVISYDELSKILNQYL